MPKDNLTILGERLRAARNKANLTQEQLSDRSHVSIKHIAGIEKGQKNPSFEILQEYRLQQLLLSWLYARFCTHLQAGFVAVSLLTSGRCFGS